MTTSLKVKEETKEVSNASLKGPQPKLKAAPPGAAPTGNTSNTNKEEPSAAVRSSFSEATAKRQPLKTPASKLSAQQQSSDSKDVPLKGKPQPTNSTNNF